MFQIPEKERGPGLLKSKIWYLDSYFVISGALSVVHILGLFSLILTSVE